MPSRLDNAASLALDTRSLAQLRVQAKLSPDKALKAAAQQFESVFLNMMLKSMREATPQDGLFDSDQTRMFTGMLDQQIAQSMASRGVGLADIMVKQLSLSVGEHAGTVADASAALPAAYNKNLQQEFISRMLPDALQVSDFSGVPPRLILAQAALESGWGRREIRMPDGSNSYNLFGIKASAGWNGKVAEALTTEYRDGVAYTQVEKFRAYGSYADAFRDYASMLSSNPRYAAVLQQQGDASGMAQALQQAGYATDPEYAAKLTAVMGILNKEG